MMTSLIHGEEGALSDALAGVLGRLRGQTYGRPQEGPEEDVHVGADGVVERLAGHFRQTEGTLFPVRSAAEIEALQEDHRLLGLFARDLAVRLAEKDREGAYRVARSFLAVLLDHIRRESSDRIEGE